MPTEASVDNAECTVHGLGLSIGPSLLLSLPPSRTAEPRPFPTPPPFQGLSSWFCFVFGDGVNSDDIFLLDFKYQNSDDFESLPMQSHGVEW